MPVCIRCLGNSRTRHVARAIIETFGGGDPARSLRNMLGKLSDLYIYEAQAEGAIHSVLNKLPNYVCSEFFDGVPSGNIGPGGIRCEDLQALSFQNNTFDLVITQDVLEHVRKPDLALGEIARILKPGGYHIFTVPANLSKENTTPLVDVSAKEDRFLSPPQYHRDSIRFKGSLVYNEFGKDLLNIIDSTGVGTHIVFSNGKEEKSYRIFGSFVFISRKN